MEDLSMFQRPRTVALEDENLGLMEGVDLPTRPIGRVWLRGLHAKHLYMGISGIYGDTSDISIHGLAPLYQILFISLVNHHSPTIATPVFLTTKIVLCVNSLGDDPSLVLVAVAAVPLSAVALSFLSSLSSH
ncbi:hypothetical protein PIB30_083161 [Stylosanthes scabra]|uniref:Uncharacterized protein n=1 Tax=Stylosanthes scabra TaxID=79078 RepID=A0ABU6RS22_9FABA|nr:hypothetical protein [Stylosanthes scabra]